MVHVVVVVDVGADVDVVAVACEPVAAVLILVGAASCCWGKGIGSPGLVNSLERRNANVVYCSKTNAGPIRRRPVKCEFSKYIRCPCYLFAKRGNVCTNKRCDNAKQIDMVMPDIVFAFNVPVVGIAYH